MLNQPNYDKEKPQFLYRGVKIKYESLEDFEFCGVDIKPPYPPKIDEEGRKIIGDGNEYGVYMTDHDVVARDAYAKVGVYDGTPINPSAKFGQCKDYTMIPSIGIVYKINTDGLDVHIPWITPHLKGHYNNGMIGDEWIAETVPAQNYIIDTIEIGPDTLHKSEMVEFDDINNVKEQILDIINKRKERLELFETAIEAMPENKRFLLDSKKIEILKSIYKLNGIMDIDINTFEPKSTTEYLDYLMAVTYQKDRDSIDFTTLSYIQDLKQIVKSETTIEDIYKRIENDIKLNEDQKESFVSRKSKNGEEYTTSVFDRKNDMYLNILKQLETKINSKKKEAYSNQNTLDTQRLGRETLEEQKETLVKDDVERDMETQMKTNAKEQQAQQTYYERPEIKTHSTENPESFRSKMRFDMTPDQYQEVLDRHATAEANFEKEMAENLEKKKTEEVEHGVK